MAKLWMKKKGEQAIEVSTDEDANAAVRLHLQGYRQVEGPDGEPPEDCGCSGQQAAEGPETEE